MNQDEIDTLRDHYDNADVADQIGEAVLHREQASEVLVSTSIRLPQSLMNQIRLQAADLGLPATTLMRQWITEQAASPVLPAVVTVADLQRFIAEQSRPIAS